MKGHDGSQELADCERTEHEREQLIVVTASCFAKSLQGFRENNSAADLGRQVNVDHGAGLEKHFAHIGQLVRRGIMPKPEIVSDCSYKRWYASHNIASRY